MMHRSLALAALSMPFFCSAQITLAHPKDDMPKASLPIRRVALYKNGVGLFEHAGQVNGNSQVTIDFTTAQLNDVLQSLTAIDLGGGRIAGAGYNSTTPIDEQLRALPLALDGNASSIAFYNAIRGAKVEVIGAGLPITGRILSIESRTEPASKADDGNETKSTERQYLTVISDAGAVHTFPLSSKVSVRVLDPVLHGDVNHYLQILADNHQQGLRHLTLSDNGTGTRDVRVSYISEVPVWKSTYRILFDNRSTSGQKQATVQGWAVVDNTVGADWTNVQLSLVAGEPQSFIQPIAQPFYTRRPELDLPEQAQLTPQTHESGNSPLDAMAILPMKARAGGVMGALGNGTGGGLGSGNGNGLGPGAGGGTAGGSYSVNGRAYVPPPSPISYEDSATASIAPQTVTSGYDDFFEYKLTEPVTILKNQSALVPILQAKLDVDPVTLYSVQDNTARRALWLRNTSNLTLDRGSFTVLESGSFSGQGLVDPVHPGERRLLTYAADTAVRVTRDGGDHDTRKLTQITVSRGVLTEKSREVREAEYLAHNSAAEPRTIIVEVPRLRGWDLDSDPKPEETTADLYRFRVEVKSGETVRLHIGQRHTLSTRYALLTTNQSQLEALLTQQGDAANVRAALQPVFDARRRLADLEARILANTTETNRILTDQDRLRKNLEALKGSAEERALARRYTAELNSQEDHLSALRQEATTLGTEHEAARAEASSKVEALEITTNL
jgi:hypothetical protein